MSDITPAEQDEARYPEETRTLEAFPTRKELYEALAQQQDLRAQLTALQQTLQGLLDQVGQAQEKVNATLAQVDQGTVALKSELTAGLETKQNKPSAPSITTYGYNAQASSYGVAVGSYANGKSSGVALGYYADGNYFGVAVGDYAKGLSVGAAVGYHANGQSGGVAVGYYAWGPTCGAAVGDHAESGTFGVAVGYNAVGYNDSVTIGAFASNSYNYYCVTIGYEACVDGAANGVAVGANAYVKQGGVAMGSGATAAGRYAVVIGRDAQNFTDNSCQITANAVDLGADLSLRAVAGETPETSFFDFVHRDRLNGTVTGRRISAAAFFNLLDAYGATDEVPDAASGYYGYGYS